MLPASLAGDPDEQPGLRDPWWPMATSARASRSVKSPGTSPSAGSALRWKEAAAPDQPAPVEHRSQAIGSSRNSVLEPAGEARSPAWRRGQTSPETAFSLPTRPPRSSEPRRFSIDGWLFLREGGVAKPSAGPLAPTYGGSQIGAVLRYDLGRRTQYLPQAYLRATAAIDSREAELAAGIGIKPLPALPLRAHGEVRLSRLGDRVELRPSAFVTAGIDEPLPLGARMRGYAQAGYVGGEFATPFADGSLVVERDAKRFERGGFALGVGAWGGAQEGTSRLDAGPTASLDMSIGEGTVRLAADYRYRVAGRAEPASGAALTLSSSF